MNAGEVPPDESAGANGLLLQSGITLQLNQVLPEVSSAVTENRALKPHCDGGTVGALQLQQHLDQVLQPTRLNQQASGRLSDLLSDAVMRRASRWYESAEGRLISRVEAESASLEAGSEDSGRFDGLMTRYLESDQWTDHRRGLIRQLLDATQTAGFVTVYNTGIVSMETMASTCSTVIRGNSAWTDGSVESEAMSTALARSDQLVASYDWNDEFVRMVLLQDLLPITGTIFRHVDNAALQAYLAFAASEEGTQFFDALVAITRDTLQAQIPRLREHFSQHLESVESSVD